MAQFNIIWNLQPQADQVSLQRAAAAIRAGISNINATVGVNTVGAQSGIAKLTSGAQSGALALRQVQNQAQTLTATLNGTVRVTNDGANAFRNFSEQAGLAARRFSAFTVAAGAMLTAVRLIKEGVSAAVDFELAMNKVEQVSSETRSTLSALRADISGLATSLGVSSAALAESAITLKQAGLSAQQTRDALEALALVDLAPAFDGQKQAAEGLIAALRQFDLDSKQFKSTFSSLNVVAAEFAVESSDIVTAIQKAGGAFKLSAGDMKTGSEALNEFVALFTSVRATTRESADSIATGLRTVFTRFQRADTVKALQDLGINLRYTKEEAEALGRTDLTQQFVGNFEAVKRLSEGLQGLRETDPRYSQVVEQLGGYRQISRVVPLLKEFKTAQEALNVAQSGQISLQIAAEKRQETLANKTAKLKEEYLDLFRKIVDSKAFQGLADSLLTVASGFGKVVDFARPLLPLMLAIATVKVGTNIGALVGGFGRSFSAAPGAATSAARPGVGLVRFAKGGLVGASTSDQNVPRGTAETGEYVSTGKSKVFSPYEPLGPRKPLGPRANDAYIQAIEILTRARKFAGGGFVSGSGNNDSEHALLMPGEFVLNKEAVAKLGVPNLRDVNDGRGRVRLQRYAAGSRTPVGGIVPDELKTRTEAEIVRQNAFQVEARGLIKTLSATPDLEGVAPVLAKLREELKASEDAVAFFTQKLQGLGTRLDQVAKTPGPAGGTTVSGSDRIAALRAKQAIVKPVTGTGAFTAEQLESSEAVARAAESSATQRALAEASSASAIAREKAARAALPSSLPEARPSANSDVHFIPEGPARNAYFNNLDTVLSAARSKHGGVNDAAFDDSVSEYFARRVTDGTVNFDASEKDLKSALRKIGRNAAASYKPGTGPVALGIDPRAPEPSGLTSLGNDELQKLLAPVGGKLPTGYGEFQKLGLSLGVPKASIYSAKSADIGPLVLKALEEKLRAQVEGTPELPALTSAVPPRSSAHDPRKDGAVPPGIGGGQPPIAPPPAPPTGGNNGPPDRNNFNVVPNPRANRQLSAEQRAAAAQGLTVERYRDLYRTESGGERRARERDFAAGNQPEQQFQVQQAILSARKDGGIVADPRGEIVRAGALFANLQSRSQNDATLDRAITNRQPGRFALGAGLGNGLSAVSPVLAGRFTEAAGYNPLDPLGGGRELRSTRVLGSLAEQKAAEDRERVLGSLGAQRQAEEQKRADRDARRLKAQGDDSARRFREVPASLAAQRAQAEASEASLIQRRTGGDFARLAVFGGSPEDRQLLRQQRDAAGIGGITDPLQIKQAAIRAFQNGDGGRDVLDAVKNKLSPAQYAQVVGAAQNAGFVPKFDRAQLTQTIAQKDLTSNVELAQFQQNDDGSRTLTGGLLAERAQKAADDRIAARGGPKALSDATQALVRSQAAVDEETKVRRELVSAQKNLLAKLQPELSSMERHIQAEDDAAKAMAGLAKVAKDSSGRLLGLQTTVSAAQAKGVDAPGAGGFGFAVQSRLGAAATNAQEFLSNNRLSRLNDRLSGYTQGAFAGRAFAAGGVASLAADRFDQAAGSAEDQVKRTGGTADFKTNKGVAGGLSGAVTGAAAGFAVGGPLGALAGTIVGGTAGIYTALRDAEADIRQAKISNALTELSDKLSAFATGLADPTSLAAIRTNIDTYRGVARTRAREDASTSLVREFFTGDQIDSGKYAASYRDNSRKELGPLLPQIGLGLTKQAERLGRANPDANTDRLLGDLRDGAQGVNAEFLRITAELRGVPVKQVEVEYKKALTSAQNAGRVDRENRKARESGEQQANALGRMLQAVQGAADSLNGLRGRASALTDVLDGVVAGTHVTSNESALEGGFGRADRAALKPLELVAGVTGDASLLNSGRAVDEVKRALFSVLPGALSKRGVEGENVTAQVSDGLYRSLGFEKAKDAPVDIQRVVNTVIGGLNEAQDGGKGVGGIREQAGTDVSKFVDRLVAAAEEPLKEFGGKSARLLEENANKFIDGLANLYQRFQQIGQLYDQLAQARTSNGRQQLQFRADVAGRSNQALEGVPLAQLEGGFNSRQQRLTGANDARAFDPAFIGQQLARVRTQIGGAVEKQQAAFAQPDGVKSGAFGAAADEVQRLKNSATNLQQALKNLADTSERGAVLQEKLQRLQQEKDGRLGLAERYATADPAERQKLERSALLANQAANKGSLDGFGAEDVRGILDFLNSARGVTLTGFKGAPRAEDLKNNLLGNSFGGAFQLTKDQKADDASVRGAIVERGQTADAAIQQLIQNQEQGSADFFGNLKSQQAEFFARLERLLLANRSTDVANRIASAEAQKGALLDKEPSRDILAQLGITKSTQVEVLGRNSGKIQSLRGAIAAEQAQTAKIDAAREGLGRVQAHQGEDRFRDALTASGLTPEQVKRVTNRAEGLFEFDSTFRGRLSAVTETTSRGSKERSDGYNDVSRQAFDQALREEKYRDISAPVRDARSKLAGIEGVDPLKIDETLRDPKKADAFIKALGAFDGGSNKIEDFGKRVEEANTKLAELRNELETVNATIKAAGPGPAPATRALGGSIFRPMGTDTVPAMLTPGEFVINAKSAAANAALIHQINEARGPVSYRAEGGFMGPMAETLAEEIEREIRERREASEAISRRKAVSGLLGAAGGIATGVRKGDLEIADLRARLTYAAAQNPFGRSAQGFAQQSAVRNELNRQKRNPNSRLSDAAKQKRAEFAGDEAAGRLAVTAQATNINRLSALNLGVRRPGDEGQKNIAARVIGVEQKGLEERFLRDPALQRFVARRFAAGGYVGQAGVGDRVPALLTGGEFVLNQAAVSRMGPHNVQRFNDGGPVGNAFGAKTNAPVAREQERRQSLELSDATVKGLSTAMSAFGQSAGRFGESAEQLSRTLNVFAGSARDLTQALNNMPKALTVTGQHQVNVTLNGAEVLNKLTPEIQQLVLGSVRQQMGRVFKEHFPDAGVSI